MTNNHYIAIEGSAKDYQEAISLAAGALYEAGFVGKDFARKCIEREKDYPTGLPTAIPTAIPHCKDAETKGNSICFLHLSRPVTFRRMDDDESSVETDLIFNLAIADAGSHLDVLQKLMQFLNDEEKLNNCRTLKGDALPAYLAKQLDC